MAEFSEELRTHLSKWELNTFENLSKLWLLSDFEYLALTFLIDSYMGCMISHFNSCCS